MTLLHAALQVFTCTAHFYTPLTCGKRASPAHEATKREAAYFLSYNEEAPPCGARGGCRRRRHREGPAVLRDVGSAWQRAGSAARRDVRTQGPSLPPEARAVSSLAWPGLRPSVPGLPPPAPPHGLPVLSLWFVVRR